MGLLRWLLIAIFIVLGYVVLSYLAGVLAPILAALGIAYLLNPILNRLVHLGVPRTVGAGALLGALVAVSAVVITFLVPRITDQIADFVHDLPLIVGNVSAWLRRHFDIDVPSNWKDYVQSADLRDAANGPSGAWRELAAAAVGGVFSVLGVLAEMLLVPVFAFYFLSDWPNLTRRIDHMVPPRRRGEFREVARDIDRVVAGWVRGQAIVTTILAMAYATGFTIVGMPLSLPIGLVVGILTVIPFVGTFVGASIALLVTLADGGSLQTLGGVAIVILCLHLLEAAVLTPKIVGHRVGLSESGALLAVVAGGKLLGFVGVVLAVPIAATVAVVVRYAMHFYEHTAFYGHESDADVVITPAMALIMPGVVPGAKIVAAEPSPDPELQPELEASESAAIAPDDDWALAPELGPSGAPMHLHHPRTARTSEPPAIEPAGDATSGKQS